MGTLWYNGTIYTMLQERDQVSSVYTEQGRIVAAGEKGEIEGKYPNIDSYEDLQGAVMFPGFVDSHLHMIALGQTMMRLDLSLVNSAEEMIKKLQEKAALLSPGQWLIGDGWNENRFPDKRILERSELDEIAPENPILLTRICRHAALVNTEALRIAGISKNTPDPEGGIIVRDENGEETGYLLDQAADLVTAVQPSVTDEELRNSLKSAVNLMLEKGLTGGHTEDLNYYGSFQRTFDAFHDIIHEDGVKFRANLLVHHEVLDDMRQLGYSHGLINDYLSFGAAKIFADGALGGRTALLREPYSDYPETNGVAIHSRKQLSELVKEARNLDMPVAIHTIGDLALEYAIDAIEKNPSLPGVRDRIIHAQITPPDLMKRLKRLQVTLDLQPRFVLSDFPWVEDRLGRERLNHSFAWKTLLHSGISCAGSSDAPIEPVDPLTGIAAAINRKNTSDSHNGYLPEQKLTPFEAVSLYTTGSAEAIGKEDEFGKIAEGFRADFTILDKDILATNPEDIEDTAVIGTVVDGEYQYKR